jgi:xylulokinase
MDPYDLLIEEAANVPPGCEGLLFLPYLSGERTPHPDPSARGAFVGLSLRHSKAHMTRSVLEGVTFGLLDSVELVRAMGLPVERVLTSGGGSRNPFWRQLMADVFNAQVITVNATQGAAFGAALLAAVGAGAFPDVREACRRTIRETSRITPGPNAGVYPAYYEHYRSLYRALKNEFESMSRLVESPVP